MPGLPATPITPHKEMQESEFVKQKNGIHSGHCVFMQLSIHRN